jgi:O-antigen/teichoic acid export membrane protein
MGISLYTSRVVLATLGVEDFGIYNVVGGVIAMFGFLNSTMSSATSRFLTFELGRQDYEKLQKTFSAALTIHIIIAVIILVLGETIGLWFLENKLIIPANRMNAARWVYQLSIISAVIGVTQVPYNATIIAHERMNVYAYVEILNVCLRLLIVYLLVIGNFDKLILYGILTMCVTMIITTIYKFYCTKNFAESRYKFHWNKEIINPMLNFSGWDLVGNISLIGRTQGVNLLLNMFFGPLLNAAAGIAVQVQGAILSFTNNFITAVRPQIIKSYANQNYQYTIKLVFNAAKFVYLLLLMLSLPIIVEMNFVLNLWLKNVPPYAVNFCRLMLLFNIFAATATIVVSAIYAAGKNKRPSLINGCLYLLVLPISYFAFKYNDGVPEIPFICNVLFMFIGMLMHIFTLKLYLPGFSIKKFLLNVLSICLIISLITFVILCYVKSCFPESFGRFCLIVLVSTTVISSMTFIMAIDKQTKQYVKQKIVNEVRKWKS